MQTIISHLEEHLNGPITQDDLKTTAEDIGKLYALQNHPTDDNPLLYSVEEHLYETMERLKREPAPDSWALAITKHIQDCWKLLGYIYTKEEEA